MAKLTFYRNILFIALFMGILSCPVILLVSGFQFKTNINEKSSKPKMPEFKINRLVGLGKDLDTFILQFQIYYDDNFTFREVLIQLYGNIKLSLLKTNPFPEKAVIGRDGWMFLGDSPTMVISETKGILNFSESELEQIAKNISESIRFFNSTGIDFYLAVAPEKSTVYGDFLPIVKSRKKPTKLDQVKRKLLKIGFRIIDLKENFPLIHNRPLYYKTDSHWNEFGEFLGYQTLMKRLKCNYPNLTISQLDDYVIDTIPDYHGDLARMLVLPLTEKQYSLTRQNVQDLVELQKKYNVPEAFWHPAVYERRFENSKRNMKILIFHDSFYQNTPKFLAPDFKETLFMWTWWNKEIITKENPDIVVLELTERNLDNLLQYPLY